MNAPAREPHIAYGTPEAVRQFVAENFGLACIHAKQAVTFADIGDDIGLEYAARRAAAYVKCALGALHDMKEAKAAKAVEEEFA
jgi:hypothetical protein